MNMNEKKEQEDEKEELRFNLQTATLTKIGCSEAVPGQVGVFAIANIKCNTDPFKLCNAAQIKTIDFSEKEITEFPRQVQDHIMKFLVSYKKRSDGLLYYPLPRSGLNILDISFYLNTSRDKSKINCEYVHSTDERGYSRIFTTRDIARDEELLIYYEIPAKQECDCCFEPLPVDCENYYKCQCPPSRCKSCAKNAILQRMMPIITKRKGKSVTTSYSAKCFHCDEDVSVEFLLEVVQECPPEEAYDRKQAVVRERAEMTTECAGTAWADRLRKKRDRGLDAMAWMPEDHTWVDCEVHQFVSAQERTYREHVSKSGGPVYKRGMFRYTYWTKGSDKEKVEDYFSEDDNTVVFGKNEKGSRRLRKGASASAEVHTKPVRVGKSGNAAGSS